MPVLLSLNTDRPVKVHHVGYSHTGLDWTVQPENFDSLIEMINKHGGPGVWSITEA